MSKRIKLGISFYILVISTLGLLLVGFVISYVSEGSLRNDKIEHDTKHIELQFSVVEQIVNDNPQIFTNPKERWKLKTHLIKNITERAGIEGIENPFIVDENYQVIISTNEEKVGTMYTNNDIRTAIKKNRKVVAEETYLKGGKKVDFLDFAFPIHIRGQVVGAVHLGMPLTFIDKEVSHLHRRLLFFTFSLIALFVLILFLFLRHLFIIPLQRVKMAATEIAQGNLSKGIPISREDEIGELSNSINVLTENLSRNLSEISLLYKIAQRSASDPNTKKVLETLLENAIQVEGAESGAIIITERGNGEDPVVMGEDLDEEKELVQEFKGDKSFIRKVMEEGEPFLLDENRIFIPLKLENEPLGVLTLSNKCSRSCSKACLVKTFTAEDMDFLDNLANKSLNVFYRDLKKARLSTIKALAAAVDAKDPYTRGHSQRVAQYAATIAQNLKFSTLEKENLQTAAYLHDIGKIGIDREILQKEGKLTDEEYIAVKAHSEISTQILEKVGLPTEVVNAVRYHHEHYDGTGYPQGLKGEEIPLSARILTVADAYDAMTSARPYRPALTFTPEEIELGENLAQSELFECAGTHFDPRIVHVFLRVLTKESAQAKHRNKEKLVSTNFEN